MTPRWLIHEEASAVLEALSNLYGYDLGLRPANPRQLTEPYTLDPETFARRWPNAPHGRQAPITIPAGWWEGVACAGSPRSKNGQLCWRTWSTTYERTRRKADLLCLKSMLRQYVLGQWP